MKDINMEEQQNQQFQQQSTPQPEKPKKKFSFKLKYIPWVVIVIIFLLGSIGIFLENALGDLFGYVILLFIPLMMISISLSDIEKKRHSAFLNYSILIFFIIISITIIVGLMYR